MTNTTVLIDIVSMPGCKPILIAGRYSPVPIATNKLRIFSTLESLLQNAEGVFQRGYLIIVRNKELEECWCGSLDDIKNFLEID